MSDITPPADDQLVYVDPEKRAVVGLVEWRPDGINVLKEKPVIEKASAPEEDKSDKRVRKPRKYYYPWCSYRTAKRVYFVEGKFKQEDHYLPFEEVLKLALSEPYWN